MLLDEVRGDLAGQPADALLPPPRRGLGLDWTSIDDVAPLGDGAAVAILRLSDQRDVFVPLVHDGHWRRAEPGDAMSGSGLHAEPPLLVHIINPAPELTDLDERTVDVDMSNDIRVIGESVVAKWQFVAEPGSMAGPRMVEHLAEAGFTEMPEPLATVSWHDRLVIAYSRFLPQALDGWDWMLDDVRRMLEGEAEAPTWPALLGALTGRLHAAAATPTAVVPEPVTRADLAPLARHYRQLLAADLDPQMREALAPWTERFERACASVEAATSAQVIPVHGDLHPGQFLRWRDGIAIGDFDGNPLLPAEDRGVPGPTAHDVAGLVRGLDHVAIAAARRVDDPDALEAGRRWARAARDEALTAYLGVGGVPTLDLSLLEALESLSPLHESVYSSTYLPRWRYVPLAVLRGGW
ncbi:MAG: hypothetical protein FJW85_12275 [Actinobacteria bacterium]|nr:hypothetical protein [Actinomycetota bacterium]